MKLIIAYIQPERLNAVMATEAVQTNLNVVWTLMAAMLVFTMQAGFAMVEPSFARAKNAANIIRKSSRDST